MSCSACFGGCLECADGGAPCCVLKAAARRHHLSRLLHYALGDVRFLVFRAATLKVPEGAMPCTLAFAIIHVCKFEISERWLHCTRHGFLEPVSYVYIGPAGMKWSSILAYVKAWRAAQNSFWVIADQSKRLSHRSLDGSILPQLRDKCLKYHKKILLHHLYLYIHMMA